MCTRYEEDKQEYLDMSDDYLSDSFSVMTKNFFNKHNNSSTQIGANAIQGLFDHGQNQAILISGESGAGKTESTKTVLGYIAEVAGSKAGLEAKILSTNPVMEAFGNAKTSRNNNSSRFGKWCEVKFDTSLCIMGAQITDYLLETTRVIDQVSSERNYHIFFQMLRGGAAGDYGLGAGDARDYNCLKHGSLNADGISDSEDWDALQNALNELNFVNDEVDDVFNIVAGLLHLSNCEFADAEVQGGDGCLLKDAAKGAASSSCGKAAHGFGFEPEKLKKALEFKRLTAGSDVTFAPQPAAKATVARDSISKLLYGKLFRWLVEKLNLTLVATARASQADVDITTKEFKNSIGLLDIAGFEHFEKNTWEQLCINLSNECLQQHFNDFVFKTEMADYR